jgi:hypothetical protein
MQDHQAKIAMREEAAQPGTAAAAAMAVISRLVVVADILATGETPAVAEM